MKNGKKSRKVLVVTTALTIVALASVLVAYAVTIGTYTGGNVTVGGVTSGTITYNNNLDGSGTWSTTLSPGSSWYTKLSVTGGFTGPVTVTWQLQSFATGSWVDVSGATVTTSISLTGTAQDIYATTNGLISGNHDWSGQASSGGTYHVIATVASA
jgi:hypothetical protein